MNKKKSGKGNRVQGGWASSGVQRNASQNLNQAQSKSQFTFSPTEQVTKVPVITTYKTDGTYELSETSNGISSVTLHRNFISVDEQEWMFQQLIDEIPWQQESIIIKGEKKVQPRLCAWFGDEKYSYSGVTLQPYKFSPTLLVLKEQIYEKYGYRFNSVLANLYRDCKDSVDWHSDDEKELGTNPIIASLSFGDIRMFEMRSKFKEDIKKSVVQHVNIPLDGGSLLIMRGATQQDWQHRVPKEYHDRNARINLTFRSINI